MCEGDIEHMNHLFLDCKYAKDCWLEVNLDFGAREEEYIHEWLLNMLAIAPEVVLIKIASVLWGIWFARNKRIFEGRIMSAACAVHWSYMQVKEWQAANQRNNVASSNDEQCTRSDQKWKPPAVDQLKINVDASVIEGQNSYAVGIVLRNSQGQFVAGKTRRFGEAVPVLEAELAGIWEAMVWSHELTSGSVVIESDSLLSVNAINQDYENILESGDLVQQCQEMIRASGRISVSYIKKQANKVAHNLAKIPCEIGCFIVFSSPPSCLLETLLSDALKV